jgi:hypothetical protein
MIELEKYEGERVDIECKDGRTFKDYLVYGYTEPEDNFAAFEKEMGSIDLQKDINDNFGISLYADEIKSIEICV